jgi:hypothetical protein
MSGRCRQREALAEYRAQLASPALALPAAELQRFSTFGNPSAAGRQYGFLPLEGVWALVFAWGLLPKAASRGGTGRGQAARVFSALESVPASCGWSGRPASQGVAD